MEMMLNVNGCMNTMDDAFVHGFVEFPQCSRCIRASNKTWGMALNVDRPMAKKTNILYN